MALPTDWAPKWKTTRAPTKVANRDAFCAEFEHASEGKQVRVYIAAHDLKGFGRIRQKEKYSHLEQVLRAILECYVDEKGMPRKHIEAPALKSLQALQRVFHEQFR